MDTFADDLVHWDVAQVKELDQDEYEASKAQNNQEIQVMFKVDMLYIIHHYIRGNIICIDRFVYYVGH